MEPRILTALSGGIDSTAMTLMLLEQCFTPVGLYIDMTGNEASIRQVRQVAAKLNVELHIEDVRNEFNELIIRHTIDEHAAGRTPSPCAVCNPLIKWKVTERVANRLGINYFATGHYVQIIDGLVHKGIDPAKDQSYYLWGLDKSTLLRARTPLGGMTKVEVREFLSRQDGFSELAISGESMSICFLEGKSYNRFIAQSLCCTVGEVVNMSGEVVGIHDGYQLYTIGQKRGFTGGGSVVSIDAANNRIRVSDSVDDLYTDSIVIRNLVFHTPTQDKELHVKIRGVGRNPQSVVQRMEALSGDRLFIKLSSRDAYAVASGQPLVFYYGDVVVGGGIIV